MNRRGFIDHENLSQELQQQEKQKLINDFKIGEYILSKVVST